MNEDRNFIKDRTTKPMTLCFTCANACGNCSWSDTSFQPIKGWTAQPTKVKMAAVHTGIVDSFHVTACPQYVPTEPNEVKTIHDDGLKPLLYAMLNNMIRDYARAVVKLQADGVSDGAVAYKRTMSEIERFVKQPMFDDIVYALEIMADGPKLLEMIRNDPQGTLDRMKAVRENKNSRKEINDDL